MTNKRPDTRESLSRNLSYLMEIADMSQAALARKSGVSQKTISNMIRGEGTALISNVDKVANAFGLTGWHLIMPNLPSDLVNSPNLERLLGSYIRASSGGREFIEQVAEREAQYRSSNNQDDNGNDDVPTPTAL